MFRPLPLIGFAGLLAIALGCETQRNTDAPPTDRTASESSDSQDSHPDPKPSDSKPAVSASASSEVSPPETERPVTGRLGPLALLAWNVESEGNDPTVIAEQLTKLAPDFDVLCLSEVLPTSFALYERALSDRFDAVRSETGRSDRLMILYARDRFQLLERQEPRRYRDWVLNDGRHRSPLFLRLEDRESGTRLVVMTTHLARGDAAFRTRQAIGLREWARDQTDPVLALGDFNMDYDFTRERGNDAFVEMLRDNIWKWVRPDPLVDTNWSDRDGDGNDDYPDSMLDFVSVAGATREWQLEATVIIREGDFPDDDSTSDHRPITLRVNGNSRSD